MEIRHPNTDLFYSLVIPLSKELLKIGTIWNFWWNIHSNRYHLIHSQDWGKWSKRPVCIFNRSYHESFKKQVRNGWNNVLKVPSRKNAIRNAGINVPLRRGVNECYAFRQRRWCNSLHPRIRRKYYETQFRKIGHCWTTCHKPVDQTSSYPWICFQ